MNRQDTDRWRESYAALTPRGAGNCPTDEQLADLVTGESISVDLREQLADHVVSCATCAKAYQLLRALDREARRDDAKIVRGRFGAKRTLLSLAAVLALVALVTVTLQFDSPSSNTVTRATVADELTIEPVWSRSDLSIAWTYLGNEDVRAFEVRMTDAGLNEIYSTRVEANRLQIPADVVDRLEDGLSVSYQVTALGPDGGVVAAMTTSGQIEP